jgi:hypothetical protein
MADDEKASCALERRLSAKGTPRIGKYVYRGRVFRGILR